MGRGLKNSFTFSLFWPVMTHELDSAPLGRETPYPSHYDPTLLFPIKRQRVIPENIKIIGWDFWRGYELSWLQTSGLPCVGLLKIMVPFDSPFMTESKSLKLYLNSFNQEKFSHASQLITRIQDDISQATGATVEVSLMMPEQFKTEFIDEPHDTGNMAEINIDQSQRTFDVYSPDAHLLRCHQQLPLITESIFSRLLKSNCPVTNQPDWASVHVHYQGRPIDHESLLAYIVSFRQHQGFHEKCVETIFADVMRVCQPQRLSVYARYTRRGGLDINPWRATLGCSPPTLMRSAQQ
jgi:7-cyano-7-deazaguanine reductase